ncbi:hypothetical protein [Halococcus sp. AFM35]|uniref:hypothetical protein n=1 Tax=Halococcus sp. AFM35 TaxID=3421653 RepID=UPI003EB782B3
MSGIGGKVGYAARELAANADDPEWWRSRLVHRINGPVQRRFADAVRPGIDVLDADWDVFIVLDGCRADLFEEVLGVGADRGGPYDSYRRVRSRASQTGEWLRTTFPKTYGDTVYVAGNPMVSMLKPDVFHHLTESWRDGVDAELNTIAAPQVTDDALKAREQHPRKRLVVHYMQPHYPFVGFPDLHFSSFEMFHEVGVELAGDDRASSVWGALGKGLVEREAVWRGYRANLEYVLEEVERLVDGFADERVVVTSDHGNLLGERLWPVPLREYGHPPGLRTPGLIEVPWAVLTGDDRPEITTGTVQSTSTADEQDINERLAALGYV